MKLIIVEVNIQEEVYIEEPEPEPEEEVEELVEIPAGKRKPRYIPGVSKPLFHSTIRGSTNERKTEFMNINFNLNTFISDII